MDDMAPDSKSPMCVLNGQEVCAFHLSETQRIDDHKERITALEKCNGDLKKEFINMDKRLTVISNDLSYIKKPLSVIAIAVVLYISGALLSLLPFAQALKGRVL